MLSHDLPRLHALLGRSGAYYPHLNQDRCLWHRSGRQGGGAGASACQQNLPRTTPVSPC